MEEVGCDWQDDDQITQVEELLMDCQQSDPVDLLAQNNTAELMRAPLGESGSFTQNMATFARQHGFETNDIYDGGSARAGQARIAYVEEYLGRAGVRLTEDDREEVKELVIEGPYYWHEGVRLDAIFTGAVKDAAVPDPEATRKLRLGGQGESVHLVLLDTINGSASSVRLPDTEVPLTLSSQRPAVLDSNPRRAGYGWDDTAGVVRSGFRTAITDAAPDE